MNARRSKHGAVNFASALLGLWLAAGVRPAAGSEFHVAAMSGDDGNSGEGWGSPFATIQRGIDAATAGDTVWVSNGVYALDGQVVLDKGVAVRSVNGAAGTFVNGKNSGTYRSFLITHAEAVLDGFTITNSYLYNPTGDARYGSAVYMTDGTVRNCVIAHNRIRNYVDTATNTAYGAGIALFGGTLENSVVVSNRLEVQRPSYGAGVYIGGPAVVRNCTIAYNTASANRYIAISRGGGVYLENGLLQNSLIHHNQATGEFDVYGTAQAIGDGGGVYLAGGVLENCLVAGNNALTRGGGVYQTGGTMRHCTVSRNVARVEGCGLYKTTAGEVISSVVWDNRQLGNLHGDTWAIKDIAVAGGAMPTYSCARELTGGTGNTAENPVFISSGTGYGTELVGGDFRLGLASPCLGTGYPDETVTRDLAGAVRPQDGRGSGTAGWDMGAYQAADATGGVFRCDLIAVPSVGIGSLNTLLTAQVAGENTNGVVYSWDFTNDGVVDVSGVGLRQVAHAYGPGRHDVAIQVTNLADETAGFVRTNVLYVAPHTAYVSTNGLAVFPYDTPAKAANHLQDAINAAERVGGDSTLVLVADGTYAVSTQIAIVKGITVQSVNGAARTVVNANNIWRGFYLEDPQAVLDGFSVINGLATFTERRDNGRGGGIYVADGTVRNCLVSNCVATSSHDLIGEGGGVFIEKGALRDSVIVANTAIPKTAARTPRGGGVYMGTGNPLVSHCLVSRNEGPFTTGTGGGYGGGVYMASGILRNCLISGNHGARLGGGVYLAAGTTVNCTVTRNLSSHASATGGGIHRTGGSVLNTIVQANGAPNPPENLAWNAEVTYSLAPELTSGTGNRSDSPQFRKAGSGYGIGFTDGDYRLDASSPCINSGSRQDWMDGAQDLAGNARIIQNVVDMGAYEWMANPATLLQIR